MANSVMLIGLGDLGGWVLEFLARQNSIATIITGDIREDYGRRKTLVAEVSSAQMGYNKQFFFHKMDVNDIDATAELIKKYDPTVIYTSVSLQSWWVSFLLPKEVHEKLEGHSGLGVFAPLHYVPASKVMQAVKKSGSKALVVNASLPDITGPVLAKKGLAPTVGQGNHDNLVAEIKKRVSDSEGVPFHEVTVFFIATHMFNTIGSRTGAPFFLKLMVRDKNITDKYDAHSLISDRIIRVPPKLVSWLLHPNVASSSVKNIMAIINDSRLFTHSPAPNGLPGGYPIRLGAKGVDVVLPEELTLEEAIKINTEANKYDGWEEVKDDGTLVFTDAAYQAAKDVLGFECKEVKFEDADEMCKDLLAAYNKLAAKYNVPTYLY